MSENKRQTIKTQTKISDKKCSSELTRRIVEFKTTGTGPGSKTSGRKK